MNAIQEVGGVKHRPGSRRAKAHQYVLGHLKDERGKIIDHIRSALKVKLSTATSWYQSFKRGASAPARKTAARKLVKKSVK